MADKRTKGIILDELCAITGWHRSHARRALQTALQPQLVSPRSPRPPKDGPDVIAALTVCWTVLGMPAGKRVRWADIAGDLGGDAQADPATAHFGETYKAAAAIRLVRHVSLARPDLRERPGQIAIPLEGIHGQVEVRVENESGLRGVWHSR